MTMRSRIAAAAAIVAMMAIVQPLFGSLEERGAELFREGVRLAREGDYRQALEYFERTMAYAPRLNVLWNIACCHVVLGNRNLAVACLDRYMEHDAAFQESAEMQAVVAAIENEPPNMPDLERRGELWGMVEAANRAVDEGRATTAAPGQRRYGVGNRGVQVKTREDAPTAEGARGMWLVGRCAEAANAGRFEEALGFAERTVAYRARPNVYYNIAALHLALGHRDFALTFMDQYQQMLPELRENSTYRQLMDDVADAPRQIDENAAWQLYRRFVDAIEQAIPPTPTPSARPPVREEMGD